MGRRMAEGAALLVDHVLPAVGYRQWVLSFPGPMAVRLGYDAPLLAAIAGRLARAVMQDMRHRVKQQQHLASVAALHAGVVTVVQRFRSDLGLYVHLHCLVTDGAYEEQNDGEMRFLAAPPPTPTRMTAVLAQVHEVIRAADDDLDLDPALAACVQLSLAGPRPAPDSPSAPPPMTLSAFGMNLHAATTADGRDRKQLERICRYLLRPPFAHDAVTALPGGRVRVSFKAPWRSGTAHADMDPHQFLARLCALVPPPGFHMTRYYGVFASHHRLREHVIPRPAAPPHRHSSRWTSPTPTTPPNPRPDPGASPGQSMRRPHACPRGRLRRRRHRPNPPRRPRSPSASSSWPGPVVPLTARPFGDVFTRPRPAAVLTAPLGPRTGRFVALALPLAPRTVPKSPDRALPAAPRAASYFTLAPKFPLQNS
jgi:hypothetical protein